MKDEVNEIGENARKMNDLQKKLQNLKSDADGCNKEKIEAEMQKLEEEIEKANENTKRNQQRIDELTEFEVKYTEELRKLEAEQKEFSGIQSTSKKKDMITKKIQNVKTAIGKQEKLIEDIKKN